MAVENRAAGPRGGSRVWSEVLSGVDRARGLFLLAAGLSFAMSVYLFFGGDHERGIFVGIWVPSILSAGTLLLGRNDHD